jgi:hypothetical protein
LVSIRKLDPGRLKSLLDDGQRGSALFTLTGLKQADSGNADSRSVGKLLLVPLNKTARRSALGRCEHAGI